MIADQLKDESRALAKREAQAEQFKRDLGSALPLKELAWKAVQNGSDPKYIAMRYGFPVEQMVAAKQEYDRREALKRDRANTARGDRNIPQDWEVSDGS